MIVSLINKVNKMTISKETGNTKIDAALEIAEKFAVIGAKNKVDMAEVVWAFETISANNKDFELVKSWNEAGFTVTNS